jgi:hypothetical protein
MKKIIWVFLVYFIFASICIAQDSDSQTAGNIILKAGSRVSGVLLSNLDVEKTKNSDDFVLILSEDIKGGGVEILKGTEIMGRVVSVKAITADNNTSEICLFFDFIKLADDYLTFKANVISITSDNATEKNSSMFKIEPSPSFKGASIISTNGKNLVIEAGLHFQLRLNQDLIKP